MRRRVIVMGASAGGVEALRAVAAGLPADLVVPVVVVLHIPRNSPSALPGILDRAGPLPAVAAEHCRRLRPGVIHVAPADRHVLVSDGLTHLSTGPTENGHRPAIDPLFRSAALAYGPGAIGVVLSGTRDDGSAGLAAIAARSGSAVVQDPTDALYGAMPASARRHVPDAVVGTADALGALLGELARSPVPEPVDPPTAAPGPAALLEAGATQPSGFRCPSCHGTLFELSGEPSPRFRCLVGHAWSPDGLEQEQSTAADDALGVAIWALEEKAALAEHLAAQAEHDGLHRSAGIHAERARRSREHAETMRELIRSVAPDSA